MQSNVINFAEKLGKISGFWTPRVVAEMNDYHFKLVKIEGEFIWHDHKSTDEVFVVVKGRLNIAMRDRTVTLAEGELFVVPKGVEHKPFAEHECHVLLIEPRGVVNTGDVGGEKTQPNDVWV